MPTWAEICDYAASKYPVTEQTADAFAVVFAYEDGRKQRVTVRRFSAFETQWLKFESRVCRFGELSPKVALRKNAEFPVGFLSLDDEGFYSFTHTAQLSTLDHAEFDLPLTVLAAAADRLEKTYSPGADEY